MSGIKKKMAAAVAAAALVAGAYSANAANVVLNDVGGVTGTPAEQGFQIAAAFWGAILADDVTINIDVGFGELGPGILGGAQSNAVVVTTAGYYNALAFDATSNLDVSAVTNLEALDATGGVTAITPGYEDPVNQTGIDTNITIVDSDGSNNNAFTVVNNANFKALGGTIDGADANVTFNSLASFDFDPSDGIDAGASDFVGVAIHEIGHALGFTSGVDTYDFLGCPDGQACGAVSDVNINDFAIAEALDHFRYSADGELNWAPGQDTYFSIDGGATQLFGNSAFQSGDFNGNGFQASHWQNNGTCSNFIGIMNPFLCSGVNGVVTSADLAALDAIGWDLNFDVLANPNVRLSTATIYQAFAVPEPSTWLQMIFGFGLLGHFMRSPAMRRRKVAAA